MATWLRSGQTEKRGYFTYEWCTCSGCDKRQAVRVVRGDLRTDMGCWECTHTTHGHTAGTSNGKRLQSPTYKTWHKMMNRCQLPSEASYPRYGGRGIRVCERWMHFANFLADMGERPEGRTLDRINNDGNYEPGNCRWATTDEQNYNKSNNRWITANGETLIFGEWAERLGLSEGALHNRIYGNGWPPELAVTLPKGTRYKRPPSQSTLSLGQRIGSKRL